MKSKDNQHKILITINDCHEMVKMNINTQTSTKIKTKYFKGQGAGFHLKSSPAVTVSTGHSLI